MDEILEKLAHMTDAELEQLQKAVKVEMWWRDTVTWGEYDPQAESISFDH